MFRSTRVCTSSTCTTGILLQLPDAEFGRKTMMQIHLPIGLMTLHTHLLRLDGRWDASVGTREQKSKGGEGGENPTGGVQQGAVHVAGQQAYVGRWRRPPLPRLPLTGRHRQHVCRGRCPIPLGRRQPCWGCCRGNTAESRLR